MSENDDFGLRNVDFEPIDRDSNGGAASKPAPTPRNDNPENKKSPLPWILGVLFLLVIGFGTYWFLSIRPAQEAKRIEAKAKQDALKQKIAEDQKREADRIAEEQAKEAEDKRAEEEEEATQLADATITILSSKTGKSYVVVGSFFDRDQAIDYCNNLKAKGVSSFVLEPIGNVRFFRVSVGDFDSYREASNNLDSFKGDYGDQLWVLKY